MSLLAGVAWVDILPDMRKFGSSLTKGVSEEQKRTADKLGKIGLAMGAGIAFGVHKAISQASDLNEAQSALTYTFGKQADMVKKWAQSQTDAFSEIDFDAKIKDMASFGRAAGLSGLDLAKFSRQTVGVAQDLASFHNVKAEDAINDIGFALQGTAQPMRKYGILIDQNVIKAQAMADGLVKATKNQTEIKAAQIAAEVAQTKLTDAIGRYGRKSLQARQAQVGLELANQKLGRAVEGNIPQLDAATTVLATQHYILKHMGPAAGDFARTSSGAANKQRIMAANTSDLVTSLGKGLLPAYKTLLTLGMEIVTYLGKHTTLVKVLAGLITSLAAGFMIYSAAVKVAAAVQAIYNLIWGETNAVMVASPIGLVVVALVALAAALIVAWKKSETFRNIVKGVFGVVKAVAMGFVHFFTRRLPQAFKYVLNWVKSHWKTIVLLISGPFMPLVALATNAFGVRSALITAFHAVLNFMKGAWQKVKMWVTAPIKGAWEVIKFVINKIISGFNFLIHGIDAIKWDPVKIFGVTVIPGWGGFGIPELPHFAKGGFLGAGELGITGEKGPELTVGGSRGTSIFPNGRIKLVIDNWREGTGYFERISQLEVARAQRHELQRVRMARA